MREFLLWVGWENQHMLRFILQMGAHPSLPSSVTQRGRVRGPVKKEFCHYCLQVRGTKPEGILQRLRRCREGTLIFTRPVPSEGQGDILRTEDKGVQELEAQMVIGLKVNVLRLRRRKTIRLI